MAEPKTYTRDEWASILGEGIHVAFRKGSDHPKAHYYWKMIQEMPNELWNDVTDYVVDSLVSMKLIEVREP
jgi:hypothetical protein